MKKHSRMNIIISFMILILIISASPAYPAGGTADPATADPATADPGATGTADSATASGSSSATEKLGNFVKKECTCQCKGDTIKSTGVHYSGRVATAADNQNAEFKCQNQCGKTCGGFSDCGGEPKECTTCCESYCSSKHKINIADASAMTSAQIAEVEASCKQACQSSCEFRGTVNALVDLIYSVAGIIGGLMIAIHGLRLIGSQDPGDREAAKGSIAHVIMALLIIALAGALVNLLTGFGPQIGPEDGDVTEKEPYESDCSRCGEGTTALCTDELCHAMEGCIYGLGLFPCQPCSEVAVSQCVGYNLFGYSACVTNPCKVPYECEWKSGKCIKKGGEDEGAPEEATFEYCDACGGAVLNTDICMYDECSALTGCHYSTDLSDTLHKCLPCSTIKKCEDYKGEFSCRDDLCGIGNCEAKRNALSMRGWDCLTVEGGSGTGTGTGSGTGTGTGTGGETTPEGETGAPVSEFSLSWPDKTTMVVSMVDKSTNAESYSWAVTETGETSTEKEPSFTFTEPGIYSFTLTVSNAAGSSTKTHMFGIGRDILLEADKIRGAAPLKVSFTVTARGEKPTGYDMVFGDGSAAVSGTFDYDSSNKVYKALIDHEYTTKTNDIFSAEMTVKYSNGNTLRSNRKGIGPVT